MARVINECCCSKIPGNIRLYFKALRYVKTQKRILLTFIIISCVINSMFFDIVVHEKNIFKKSFALISFFSFYCTNFCTNLWTNFIYCRNQGRVVYEMASGLFNIIQHY